MSAKLKLSIGCAAVVLTGVIAWALYFGQIVTGSSAAPVDAARSVLAGKVPRGRLIWSNDGQITLSTAFRPGVRLSIPGSQARVSLPLEIAVEDNGSGVPADLVQHLFDPFVSTKQSGTGLGLALVAKIIGDHGGIIECDSRPRHTVFRALMPMASSDGTTRIAQTTEHSEAQI